MRASQAEVEADQLLDTRLGGWLCPTDLDRARITANSRRVGLARLIVSLVIGATMVYFAPHLGAWTVPLFVLCVAGTATTDWRIKRARHPEYQVVITLLWVQIFTVGAVLLSGGAHSPVIPLVSLPTLFSAARFRREVVYVFAAIATVMVVGATVGMDAAAVFANPGPLIVGVGMLIGGTAIVVAIGNAEVEQRNESVLDPLTGLLNRSGLARRFEEVAGQARVTNAPVSLVLCDVDHFKMINDLDGHDRGDSVLRELADELRSQLRSFELIYRIGGEEFLIILPGAAARHACVLAERLRLATERRRPGGTDVTISIGVSTARGEGARFAAMFKAADDALYAAKAQGRNRVVAARDDNQAHSRRFAATPKEVVTVASAGA